MNITKQQTLVSEPKVAHCRNLLLGGFSYNSDSNIAEAQQQVTANLANFAYDPINYQFLKDASAIDLFIQLLASPNPQLQLHGSAGICNIVPGKAISFSNKCKSLI